MLQRNVHDIDKWKIKKTLTLFIKIKQNVLYFYGKYILLKLEKLQREVNHLNVVFILFFIFLRVYYIHKDGVYMEASKPK